MKYNISHLVLDLSMNVRLHLNKLTCDIFPRNSNCWLQFLEGSIISITSTINNYKE